MGARFSRPTVVCLLGLAVCGAGGGAQAAVVIDWFQDPSGLLPYGQGIEFVAYSTGATNVSSSFISLDWTDYSKHTVIASSTGGTYDQGAPLATLTSTKAGDPSNTLTAFSFAPGPDKPFNTLVGAYFLSTIDSASPTTTITVTVDYFNITTDSPGTETHVFSVDTPDVGRIGFGPDYSLSDHYEITSMTFALPVGEAAWNTVDDLVFAVPEPSTWAMLLAGFGGLAGFGFARSRSRSAIPAA
jgi:PEP-CTERM motif